MKKFLLFILILFLFFSGYIVYDTYFANRIKKLEIQDEIINISDLYIYGTHLNMSGNVINDENLDLILYDGDFQSIKININDNVFNLSNYVNDGIYLENINRGIYYLYLRSTSKDNDGNDIYKYYALKNNTKFNNTEYYTFSDKNNKIVINYDEDYSTIKMNVSEVKDSSNIYDIVIDPGHGGRDGGAAKFGYDEADFTLKLAIKVKNNLEKSGFKVLLTHVEGQLSDKDRLEEYGTHGRAVLPHEVKAKYIFSIHMNSNNDSNVNGLEVYTADKINYEFAKNMVNNIIKETNLNISNNKINKVMDSIYTRNFTNDEVNNSIKEYKEKNLKPYDITINSNYYYIIRETGGIITGAYVDNRNSSIDGNPYTNSNVGCEAYLLELGYISNKSDLDNMINNMDKYAIGISKTVNLLNIK